jgi:transposase
VDTSVDAPATDRLGRRTGPRRKYTLAEKQAIVVETRQRGCSVAVVARRHGINANIVFGWRRLYRQGLLSADAAVEAPALLPVTIETPTVVPGEPASGKESHRAHRRDRGGAIEIEFAGGVRVRVHGKVDRTTLARVIAVLSGR